MPLTRFNLGTQVKLFTLIIGTVGVLSLTKYLEHQNDVIGGSNSNSSEIQNDFVLNDPSVDPKSDNSDFTIKKSSRSVQERHSKSVKHEDFNLHKLHYRLPSNLVPFEYHIKIRPVLPFVSAPGLNYSNSTADSVLSEAENSTIVIAGENDLENDLENEPDPINENATVSANNLYFPLFSALGSIVISFECVAATSSIVLHQQNISIDEQRVEVFEYKDEEVDSEESEKEDDGKIDEGNKITILGFEYDGVQDFFTIILKESLVVGRKYSVAMVFTTNLLRQDSSGIFSNSYYDPATNSTKYMVGTKFQATHARRAFPCFDEPALKAVFHISLARRGDYHTLSNAPLSHSTEDSEYSGWTWDHYKPSLKMSTYLVCVAVSEFKSQEADPALLTNGRAVQVWAPTHFIDKGGGIYAADWTANVIAYFEDYFNMTDALPKVDSIMIPQFTTSAMENWGLITYKEHMLIYVPNENTEYRRGLVSTVVAHELSHHWFGNLVTCRWWSDIWLNEGFATYLSFLVLEDLRPELDAQHEFINDVVQLSMRSDPKLSTDSVRNRARSQGEIDSAFSRTSYRKGASLIHMMKHFLGEVALRKGLQNYIRKFAYGTVVQDDLFHELTLVGQSILPTGISVKEIMDTWTLKSGYPIVRVNTAGENAIKISQETFRLAPLDREMTPSGNANNRGEYWWVPIKIATASSNATANFPQTWIPSNTSSIVYKDGIDTAEWIVVNPDFAGYFLVLYDTHLTRLIKNQLDTDHTVFSPITRSHIMFSYIYALHANYIRKDTALDLFTYLGKETDFIVWNTVFPFVGELSRKLLGSEKFHDSLTNFLVPRVVKLLQSPEIGLHPDLHGPEKPTTAFFRTELLSLACQLDSIICASSDPGFFHKLMSTGPDAHVLSTHVEEMMLCALVKSGGESMWEFALEKYQTETQDFAQWWYMKALTCTYSTPLIQRTLDVISNASLHTFPSNRPGGLHHLATNKYAFNLVFNYLLENFGVEAELVTPDVFSATILTLSNFMHKAEDINKLKNFIKSNRESLAKELPSLAQSVTAMEENLVWMEFHGTAYANWFLQNANSPL